MQVLTAAFMIVSIIGAIVSWFQTNKNIKIRDQIETQVQSSRIFMAGNRIENNGRDGVHLGNE